MAIRLYIGPDSGDIHIARKNASETFCGINVRKPQLVGTMEVPSGFTPHPDAMHDDCLNAFMQRHDQDMSSSGESLGWEDMGE